MTVAHKQCGIDYIPEVLEAYAINATDDIGFKANLNTLNERYKYVHGMQKYC